MRRYMEKVAVSIQEVTQITGLSRSSIYKAMKQEGLKSFSIGRSRRFLLSEVNRWLEAQSAKDEQ